MRGGGDPGYADTSRILAEVGTLLATETADGGALTGRRGGVLTPAAAFGDGGWINRPCSTVFGIWYARKVTAVTTASAAAAPRHPHHISRSSSSMSAFVEPRVRTDPSAVTTRMATTLCTESPRFL